VAKGPGPAQRLGSKPDYDRTNNVQMVALDHVPAGTYHITVVRADNTPLPDQAQRYAICALGNLNSELGVRG